MTDLFWLLTLVDVSLRSTVDLVPEQDIKNLTDDQMYLFNINIKYSHVYYNCLFEWISQIILKKIQH